jgi:hypothetical protein
MPGLHPAGLLRIEKTGDFNCGTRVQPAAPLTAAARPAVGSRRGSSACAGFGVNFRHTLCDKFQLRLQGLGPSFQCIDFQIRIRFLTGCGVSVSSGIGPEPRPAGNAGGMAQVPPSPAAAESTTPAAAPHAETHSETTSGN